jgi:PKD repeat protein
VRSDLKAYVEQDITAEEVMLASMPKPEPVKLVKEEAIEQKLAAAEKQVETAPAKAEAPVEVKPTKQQAESINIATEPEVKPEVKPEVVPEAQPAKKIKAVKQKPEKKPKVVKPRPVKQPKLAKPKPVKIKAAVPAGEPVAVIVAKPIKGYSPLTVHFSAAKSHIVSGKGRIVSYSWDFGDGDASTKSSVVNTYLSSTLDPRYYTAVLTVTDDKGNTSDASVTIEVLNR